MWLAHQLWEISKHGAAEWAAYGMGTWRGLCMMNVQETLPGPDGPGLGGQAAPQVGPLRPRLRCSKCAGTSMSWALLDS